MAGFELLEGVRAVPPAEWNALVGEGSPFLEWEWLAALEESVGEHAARSDDWEAR